MSRSSSIKSTRLGALAVASALAALVTLPGTASARASRLVLEVSGVAVAPGSPADVTAKLGPCGTITGAGTLAGNDRGTDRAAFTEGGSTGGGCGEAGPLFSGRVEAAHVTSAGVLTLLGEMTYITGHPGYCTYSLKKLEGTFAMPGSTAATVSGVGTRVGSRKTGCALHATLEGVEAKLGPTESGPAFEALLA